MNFKYYLIHGVDPSRKQFMLDQFAAYGIDNNDVTWLCHPNKNEITKDMVKAYTTKYSRGGPQEYVNDNLGLGQISCTIKHFLALKDIVEKQLPYAVIMEDNVAFHSNIPERLTKYLEQLPSDWDALFDTDWRAFNESPVTSDKLVYKKKNEVTEYCHGASRLANFILVSLKGATALYQNYLPFNHVSDWYYNNLFRRLELNSYWAEPGNTYHVERPSTW
jgi:GR25 family glycosyltransferase involved in LPS biosynthesis